jgi:hypothetical protein
LLCRIGRDRAIAVSRRASSRFLVGLDTRGCSFGGVSWVDEVLDGSTLFMNVHRFLFGTTLEVSLTALLKLVSAVSTFVKAESEECLLLAVD